MSVDVLIWTRKWFLEVIDNLHLLCATTLLLRYIVTSASKNTMEIIKNLVIKLMYKLAGSVF